MVVPAQASGHGFNSEFVRVYRYEYILYSPQAYLTGAIVQRNLQGTPNRYTSVFASIS